MKWRGRRYFIKPWKKFFSNLFSTWEKCVSLNCGNLCRTTHILLCNMDWFCKPFTRSRHSMARGNYPVIKVLQVALLYLHYTYSHKMRNIRRNNLESSRIKVSQKFSLHYHYYSGLILYQQDAICNTFIIRRPLPPYHNVGLIYPPADALSYHCINIVCVVRDAPVVRVSLFIGAKVSESPLFGFVKFSRTTNFLYYFYDFENFLDLIWTHVCKNVTISRCFLWKCCGFWKYC